MRPLIGSLMLGVMLATTGCGKAERGVGEWQRVGECEVQIESVQFGKVKGGSMFGPGESRDDVLSVRTLFRNADSAVEVKHSPWQADSSMLTSGIALTDAKGTRYQTVHFGLFGKIDGRQLKDAELKAADVPISDVLTFEANAAKADELILELPTQWFIKQADGSWGFHSHSGKKFKFRIPRSAWEGANAPAEKK